MISHVTLGVAQVDRAIAFYAPLMDLLGWALKFSDDDWAGWKAPGAARPLFIVMRPYDGRAASPGNGVMVAVQAKTRSVVDACHAMALRQGGDDEGGPRLRPQYHPDYYGAYFRDPDGNKLCICCHAPEGA